MQKPTYWKVVLFLIVKTVVFAIFIAFVHNRYISYITDPYKEAGLLTNTISYMGYILIFGIIPTFVIFSFPIYLSFRIKRPIYFAAAIVAILLLDYLSYSWLDGFANNLERFYFWISDLFCFLFFFYRTINTKRGKNFMNWVIIFLGGLVASCTAIAQFSNWEMPVISDWYVIKSFQTVF